MKTNMANACMVVLCTSCNKSKNITQIKTIQEITTKLQNVGKEAGLKH